MEVEEKLKQIVEKFLGHGCHWKYSSKAELEDINLAGRRNLSEIEGRPYKYIECTELNKGAEICVGIGFNPAEQSPGKIDRTNRKIIHALCRGNYKTFILLNLYPLVTSSKVDFDEADERSLAFSKQCLPELLEYIYKDTSADVLIFWGRTVSVDGEIFKKIREFCKAQRLYMTVKKGDKKHCHPARVPIVIQPVSQNNLKETYSVR